MAATQVAAAAHPWQQQQPPWHAAASSSPTYYDPASSSRMSSSSWAGAAAAGLPPPPPPDSSLGWSGFLPPGADFGQDYVGFRFPKNPQPLQEAGTILAEDSPSSSSGGTGSTTEEVAGEMPAQKGNRKALCKLSRLVKRRGDDVAIMTVFNSEGQILCSLAGKEAGQEHAYEPSSEEGKYLGLALARGFKSQRCAFDFGGAVWRSGAQEEVDDKQTMLGDMDERQHRFYGVLSPTGRYVVAAVLKCREEAAGGGGDVQPVVDAKLLRKVRAAADNFEVYEACAGSRKLMAKLACAA